MIPHSNKIVGLVQSIVYRTTGSFIFQRTGKIFIYNGRVKEFLIAHHVNERKIVAITNGTNLELFHPTDLQKRQILRRKYGLPLNKTLALFVGRFVPKKGYSKLLKAASDKYTIVFVGGISPQKHKDDKRYRFMGALSQLELADIYRACDIFILPSEGEGFPLSIQEAMASGLPIITTDDEGYDIHNFDRKLFKLINPSVQQIKEHITKLSEDGNLRKAMSLYSLTYAKLHFDWDATAEELTNQYRQILS
jgi:D-inositol-3-phosphate glycosyltransferase